MAKIILDLAVTSDGYIAGSNGEIDWLVKDGEKDFGDILADILIGVDAIFYGRVSYDLQGNCQPSDKASPKLKEAEARTILTFDRDYGELIFKHDYRPKKGVIYLRLDEYTADEPGRIIEDLIHKKEFNFDNALTVVDIKGVRQRKY